MWQRGASRGTEVARCGRIHQSVVQYFLSAQIIFLPNKIVTMLSVLLTDPTISETQLIIIACTVAFVVIICIVVVVVVVVVYIVLRRRNQVCSYKAF